MSTAVKAAPSRAALADSIQYHLRYTLGKSREEASKQDVFQALAHSVRARLIDGLFATEKRNREKQAKRLVYLSASASRCATTSST